MEIQLESAEPNTIRSYSNTNILVAQTTIEQSCIICKQSIQTDWPIHHISEFNLEHLTPFLQFSPEVIIIGHVGPSRISPNVVSELSRQRIGLECMSIGAACRTFNVLLGEQRAVVLGIIFE